MTTPWFERSQEERWLLNPCFCATLLWFTASGFSKENERGFAFEEAFLVLPIVLHRETRTSLPRSISTSLAVWLENYPLTRGRIASHAKILVPYTKESLLFGGLRGLFRFEIGQIVANDQWKRYINLSMKESSDEVRECASKAEFLGKWFSQSGNGYTVLALIGVQP